MSQADIIYKNLIKEIVEHGEYDNDFDVRTKYADGTPAYTKSIFGKQIIYEKDVLPLLTSKKVFTKTALKEAILFWCKQSVKEEDFKAENCKIWDEWFKNGSLGKSYAYQFESRPKEKIIDAEYRLVDLPFYDLELTCTNIKDITAKNYREDHLTILYEQWEDLIFHHNDGSYVLAKEWQSFDTFLHEIRYIPQFFIAQADNFKKWYIDPVYFNSNAHSKDTCVWQHEKALERQNKMCATTRFEISRNQVVDLINNIKNTPKSRRLMTSFWNDADVKEKALQECVWNTQWKVKNNKDLELMLGIRSNDIGLGNPFNVFQYKAIQMALAHTSGLNAGRMIVNIGDLHFYDRHEDVLKEQLNLPEYDQPTIRINPYLKDFFNLTPDDIIIENYECGKYLPMEVAI